MNHKWKRIFWDWAIPFILVVAIGWLLILLNGCQSVGELETKAETKSVTRLDIIGTIDGVAVDLTADLVTDTTEDKRANERVTRNVNAGGLGSLDILGGLAGGGGLLGALFMLIRSILNSKEGQAFGPITKQKDSNP